MSKISLPFLIISLVALLGIMAAQFVIHVQYDRDVKGHLKRASDANQVTLAIDEIETALEGMDRRGLVCAEGASCYTSILYTTPDEDIGFWRTNIEQTLSDLRDIPEDADHLTVSNTLMKVRETLLDAGESGDYVTSPSGTSLFPNNTVWAIFGWLSLLGCCVFGLGTAVEYA